MSAPPPGRARRVAVASWGPGLLSVPVRVGGRDAEFLLDTGSGLTSLDAGLVRELGLRPWGRLTGHRMSGERIDLERVEDVSVDLDGLPLARETVGVIDFRRLLPPGLDPPGGVLGLDAFERTPCVLDLAARVLHLPAGARELEEATASWCRLATSTSRVLGGAALDLFVRVPSSSGTLRLILDTGNTGPVVLSAHAAAALGAEDGSVLLPLRPEGVRTPAVVREVIYDGNVGLGFLRDLALAVDLGRDLVRLRLPPAAGA